MSKLRDEFAHAILEARLRENFVDVEYKDSAGFNTPTSVPLVEPLHDESPKRVLEAVENIAIRIAASTSRKRTRIISSRLTFSSADIRLTVLDFREI